MTKRTILVPVDDTTVSALQPQRRFPVVNACSHQSIAVLQDSERAVDWALANLYQKGATPLSSSACEPLCACGWCPSWLPHSNGSRKLLDPR